MSLFDAPAGPTLAQAVAHLEGLYTVATDEPAAVSVRTFDAATVLLRWANELEAEVATLRAKLARFMGEAGK